MNDKIKNLSLSIIKFNKLIKEIAGNEFYTINPEIKQYSIGGGGEMVITYTVYIHGLGIETSKSTNEIIHKFRQIQKKKILTYNKNN